MCWKNGEVLKRRRSSRSTNTGDESSTEDSELDEPPNKTITLQSGSSSWLSDTSSSSSSTMLSCKANLLYDPKWKKQYPWMEYNSSMKGMVCSVCTAFGKVPIQAKLSLLAEKHGGVVEQIISFSEEEKQQNRTFLKKLVHSLSFVVKQHIPHNTTFEGLIRLQIENGDIQLSSHRDKCLGNATYMNHMPQL